MRFSAMKGSSRERDQLALGAAHQRRGERLPGRAVGDQLERPEHTGAADLADHRVLVGERRETGSDHVGADLLRVGDDAFALHRVDRRHDRGRRQRMAAVGQAPREHPVVEGAGDRVADDDTTDRDVAGVDALGEGDQVGHDVMGVEREPLARAAEPGHHLVEDQHDAVLVGEGTHPCQVAGRRHHDPGGAGNRLQQDRGDAVGAFGLDHPAQVLQGPRALLLRRGGPELRAVEVGAEHVDVAPCVLVGHPAPVAGRDDRPAGVAVVGAVRRHDLVAPGVQTCHPDGVLVGVGAAVGEEHLVEALGRAGGDPLGGDAPGQVGGRGPIVASVAACSWMAWTTAGCWWPMLTLTSWLEKSR